MFAIGLKPDVEVEGLSNEVLLAYVIIGFICLKLDIEYTVTSITDGEHSAKSKHITGDAFDVRTRNMSKEEINAFADIIRASLTKDYDVVIEPDHIHIEYDPRR